MNKVVVVWSAIAALGAIGYGANPANAQGYSAGPVEPAWYNWTGVYIGGHGGWQDANTKGHHFIGSAATGFLGPLAGLADFGPTDQSIHGWLAGAQLGYNYQFKRAVLGIEISGSRANINGDSSGAGTVPPNTGSPMGCAQFVTAGTGSMSCNAKQDWTVNALSRLGYTFLGGQLLTYVAAGVAFTDLTMSTTLSDGPSRQITFGGSKEMAGAVVGVGAQFALGKGVSIGAEYLYTKYPSQDFTSIGTCTGNCAGNHVTWPVQESHDLTTNTFRGVLNFKLD